MRARERWLQGASKMGYITERDKAFVADTYARFPVEIISGKGSVLYGADGKEYIDMGSGIGVTAFGAADDAWVSAVSAQLGRVAHTSNLYYTEPCGMLAELLCKKTGMSKVFFSNSGAEANECAIKVARKYSSEKKGEDCFTVVTLENSFHGRTLTTLSATGQAHYHELFNPLTPGFVHTPANNIEAFLKTVAEHKAAGVMIECVQGEGGVLPLERDFVLAVEKYCKDTDTPLIIDEVQTGNGRTGELYAYMNFGIEPDIVSTAKGIGGGLPLGATMLSKKVEGVLGHGDHGSTFGGNPVACAGGYSIISRIDEKLLSEIKEKSKYIFDTLSGADGVVSVSGMGLMIGIKTEKKAIDIVNKCIEDGVLCLTAKDNVRLLPALNIPMDTLVRAVEIIKCACAL